MPTVVVIRSLSFTGTTWINLLLGCHPRALALGPPQGKWELEPAEADQACVLHHGSCPLWCDFVRTWDRSGSFFAQLAEHSGRDVIVLNNPTKALRERELVDPSFEVKHVHVVRDGRANVASCMRHHPDRYDTVYEAVRHWLRPASERVRKEMSRQDRVLYVRYEDAVTDPHGMLDRAGAFLGIEYPESATRYWEFEHHLLSGNTGAVDMLIRLQGGRGFGEHARKEYYDELLENTRRNPDARVVDESWRETFSLQDRFAFDYLFGDLHAAFGYLRDRFTVDETRRCLDDWGLPLGNADVAEWPAHTPRTPVEPIPYREEDAGGAVNEGPRTMERGHDAREPALSVDRGSGWFARILGRS